MFIYKILKIILIFLVLFLFSNTVKATYLTENTTWESNLTSLRYTSLVLGDLDGNSYLDLVVMGSDTWGNEKTKVYLNNGSGFAENSTWQSNLTAVNYGSLALGDVDNDGDLDLALTGCSSGATTISNCDENNYHSKIYINNGSSLIENSTWKEDIIDVYDGVIALGDIDNDGKLDLALTGQNDTARISKIYINNGSSFIENSTWGGNLRGLDESSLVFGDIDNDNDLDLLLSGEDGTFKYTEVYINNGTSLVQNSTWDTNLLDVDKGSLALGDYNNDRRLDLTLIGCCDRHFTYNNTGTSFIADQGDVHSNEDIFIGVFEGSVVFGDYDNNGYLDIAATGREKYSRVYNNTNGVFESYVNNPEPSLIALEWSSTVWGDLDNDSDLDLILFGYDGDIPRALIYTNNISTANSKPEAPNSSFNASFDDGKLILEWGNGSDAETSVLGLYYNIRVGTSSGGNDVISGVYGGGDDNGYFGNMMQRKSISIKDLDASTDYYYSIQTIDTGLMKSSWSDEQHYKTNPDIINPTIEFIFPADGYYSNKNYVHFGANVTDETDLDNVSLYGDWTGSTVINQTNSTGRNGNHTFNVSLNDGTYSFYIQACDDTGNCRETSTRTVNVDTTYPNISLNSPLNSSTWSSSLTVNFTYNVSDISIVNCSLIINDEIDQTDSSISVNVHQSFTKTLSNGNYNWSVNCTDNVDQLNNSETWKLTVDYTAPTTTTPPSTTTTGGGGSAAKVAKAEALAAKSQIAVKSIPRVYDKIKKDETKTYENKKTEISISKITFDTKEDVQQGEISINSLKSNPATSLSKPVYQYLEINNNFDTKEAKIKFNVEKQWISENNIDKNTVKLNRYTNKWNELITNEVDSTYTDFVYEAISPGFSYFAVTAENKTVEVKEEILEIEEPVEVKEINPLVWIIIIFFSLLIWYHYVCKLNKKNKNVNKKRN